MMMQRLLAGLLFCYFIMIIPVFGQEKYWQATFSESIWNPDEAVKNRSDTPPSLYAARGETEHLQIIILPTEAEINKKIDRLNMLTVNFKISDFKDDRGNLINKRNIKFRRVEKIEDWEDVLVPGNEVVLNDNKRRFMWLTVKVPDEAVPGEYVATLTCSDKDVNVEHEVKLRVLNFKLPQKPSIPAVFGIRGEGFMGLDKQLWLEPGSEKLKEKMSGYVDFLINYRISPFICNWMDNKQVDTYTSPWPLYDPRSKKYLDDPRITHIALPLLKRTGREFNGYDSIELKKNFEALKRSSGAHKPYVYVWDEPTSIELYNKALEMSGIVHRTSPDIDVFTSFYTGFNKTLEVADLQKIPQFFGNKGKRIFAYSEWAWRGNYKTVELFKEMLNPDNEKLWLYVCSGPAGSHPNVLFGMSGVQNRAVLWRVWAEGGTGFLYWVVNNLTFRDGGLALYNMGNGDGVLVYPGEYYGVTGPVASCRLERWLDGMEDYEYLTAIKNKKGKQAADTMLSGFYTLPNTTASKFPGIKSINDFKIKADELLR